jgi:hypothetical protein
MVSDDLCSSLLVTAGDKVRAGDMNAATSAIASVSSSSDSAVIVSPLSELVNDVRLSDTEDVAELVKVKLAIGPKDAFDSLYFMDTSVAWVPVGKFGCNVSLYTSLRNFQTPSGLLNSVPLKSVSDGGKGGNRGVRLGDMFSRGGGAYGVEAVKACFFHCRL